MRRDMRGWFAQQIAAPVKRALPILSFPAVQLMGCTVRELISDSARQAEGMACVARRMPSAASVSLMDLSVEAECFGAQVRVTDDEVPTVVGRLVATAAEAGRLRTPQVGAGRSGVCVEAIRRAAVRLEDRPVLAGVIGPFSLAGRLMDVTEILYACYDEPETVHTVLDKATEFLTDYCRAFRDAGADGVVVAEPLAGLLTPALAAEFSCAYARRMVEAVQSDGFAVVYHNCGGAVPAMLDDILSTGCMAYHFGNAVSMADILPRMPADTVCMGNIDPAGVLKDGTPDLVYRRTLALLEACGDHANFLLSSGCDIPPATPWANVDAFFAAADAFYRGRNA